jgi:hypothetical protein
MPFRLIPPAGLIATDPRVGQKISRLQMLAPNLTGSPVSVAELIELIRAGCHARAIDLESTLLNPRCVTHAPLMRHFVILWVRLPNSPWDQYCRLNL